ncbi:MAG: polysaccharide deacetylase family protein [Deltaproteobacteria bacterium]|nr:polysaccharide deacetylase family protein [Deltaproteobacteria bacterium]
MRSNRRSTALRTLKTLAVLGFLGAALGSFSWNVGAATLSENERTPLLVTVDDLPLMAGDLFSEPVEKRRVTEELLRVLAKHQVPAVGMVTWKRLTQEEDLALLRLWLEAGHELGNHTVEHLNYNRTDFATFRADAEEARRRLVGLLSPLGKSLRFFRFPQLHEGETLEKLQAMREYLDESGQRNLPVTLDNSDWRFERSWVEARQAGDDQTLADLGRDYQEAVRSAVRSYRQLGDELFARPVPQILLLHAGEVGAAQWDELFLWLKAEGFRFATADEVLGDGAFQEPAEYVGPLGLSLWDRLADHRRQGAARKEILAMLAEQSAAWSRGDVEIFCSFYTEDTAFVSPTGLTRGRQQVLERYRKRYPGREAMGTLELELIELRLGVGIETAAFGDRRPSGVHSASAVATWSLSYPDKETLSGLTLLVFHKNSEGVWQIIQDASM